MLDTKLARVLWRKGQSTLAAEVKARIVEMKGEGHGKRVIARALGLHPAVVQAYLQDVFGVGPASTPQMRAHQHPEVAPAASAFAEQWERELTARQGS